MFKIGNFTLIDEEKVEEMKETVLRYKIVYQSRFTSFFNQLTKNTQQVIQQPILLPDNNKEEPSNHFSKRELRKTLHPVDIDNIKNDSEKRTTVVLKNISKKLKMPDLLELFHKNSINGYDVVYFPLKRKSLKNFGFAFVNFTDPKSIIKFFEIFNRKADDDLLKPYEVFYCHTQGAKKIKKNYAAKFVYVNDEQHNNPSTSNNHSNSNRPVIAQGINAPDSD